MGKGKGGRVRVREESGNSNSINNSHNDSSRLFLVLFKMIRDNNRVLRPAISSAGL